jgi:tetratricopeptide (TPR) repeat protein
MVPFAALLYYALRGGSYDIVVRQEEGLAIWWLLGLGVLVCVLPLALAPRRVLLPVALFLLFAGWTAVSLGWSESDANTVAELARILHLLGIVVLVWALVDHSTWRAAAAGVAAAAVAVSLLALASRLAPGAFPSDLVARGFRITRLNYPFHYWNAVAAWGAMSIALALPWSAHAERVASRAVALAVVPGCALAVYLSYSRAGVGGSALAVLAAIAFSRNRWQTLLHALVAAGGAALAIVVTRQQPEIAEASGNAGAWAVAAALGGAALACVAVVALTSLAGAERWQLPGRTARLALPVAAAILILVGALAGPSLGSDAWDQFQSSKATVSQSDPAARLGSLGGARKNIWDSALQAYRSERFHGIGAGSFEFWWGRTSGPHYEFLRDAHNLYLEQLGELGLLGLVLILLLLASLAYVALRARRDLASPAELGANAALVAAFAVFLLHAGVDWMWEETAVPALALTAVAVAAAASTPLPRARPRLRWRWRIPIVVIAAVFALVQLPGLVSSSRVRDSQQAIRTGDLQTAGADALDAIDAEPWAAEPYTQAALVFQSQGQLGRAAADARAAIRREPTNSRHWLVLASIEAGRGNTQAALNAFRQAKRLRPRAAVFQPPP